MSLEEKQRLELLEAVHQGEVELSGCVWVEHGTMVTLDSAESQDLAMMNMDHSPLEFSKESIRLLRILTIWLLKHEKWLFKPRDTSDVEL